MPAPAVSEQPAPSGPKSGFVFPFRWLVGALIVLAGAVVYWNSLEAPFVFDDNPSILENPTIRQVWGSWSPPMNGSGVGARPLVNFSLALNYAAGGYNVPGYHLTNLAIHLLAGLTLFGLVRRTLRGPRLRERFGAAALPLAFFSALLWTIHPLQTEAVTSVIQRTESLMGLFYLLTLYCFVRAKESPRPRLWLYLSVLASFLGMLTKEVMATAPLLVFLYDYTFVSATGGAAWRERRGYYCSLGSTWLVLAWLVFGGQQRDGTAGWGLGVSPWDYLLTQCQALVHYLYLAFWPHPLVLDYGTGLVTNPGKVWPQGLLLVGLFGATLYALRRRWPLGFLGGWFFLILAPSSSILPITTQTMAEHRMYLPLAALVVTAVVGMYAWLGRRAAYFGLVAALVFSLLTIHRNDDYRSEEQLWISNLNYETGNWRVYYNLGLVYEKLDLPSEALSEYRHALALKPDARNVLGNLGLLLAKLGDYAGAEAMYRRALDYKFDDREIHYNYGNLLLLHGRTAEAITQYQSALLADANYAPAHNNLGAAYLNLGRADAAVREFGTAARLDPANVGDHYNLANTLLRLNRFAAAIPEYEAVLRLQPDHAEAHHELGMALANTGKMAEAISHFEQALKLKPTFPEAQTALDLVRQLYPTPPLAP